AQVRQMVSLGCRQLRLSSAGWAPCRQRPGTPVSDGLPTTSEAKPENLSDQESAISAPIAIPTATSQTIVGSVRKMCMSAPHPRTIWLPTTWTGTAGSGRLAGPLITAPVTALKRLPWHGQVTTPAAGLPTEQP